MLARPSANSPNTVPVAAFDAGDALRMIEELRITHTGGAPTMYWSLLDHPTRPQRDLSSLRLAIASAAYVPAELVQRMRHELGVHPITGYGLTEAHAIVSVSQPDDPPELVAAVGRAAAVLGWRASHSSLEEILSSAWRWHQAHPQGYRGGFGAFSGPRRDPHDAAAQRANIAAACRPQHE